MYKEAAKRKLKFQSERGLLTVEDLFDLKLTGKCSLDTVSRGAIKAKTEKTESLVASTRRTQEQIMNDLRIDILRDIIRDKQAEAEATAKREETKILEQKIVGAIERKRDAALENASEEELIAKLEALKTGATS